MAGNVVSLARSGQPPAEISHRRQFHSARAAMARAFLAWITAENPSPDEIRMELDGTIQALQSLADLGGTEE